MRLCATMVSPSSAAASRSRGEDTLIGGDSDDAERRLRAAQQRRSALMKRQRCLREETTGDRHCGLTAHCTLHTAHCTRHRLCSTLQQPLCAGRLRAQRQPLRGCTSESMQAYNKSGVMGAGSRRARARAENERAGAVYTTELLMVWREGKEGRPTNERPALSDRR